MPIVSLVEDNPFTDGRQSSRALEIRCGVERYLAETGIATLPELSFENGRRADLVGVCQKGMITVVEVKSSIADFNADSKWPHYREWCDRLFFATLPDVTAEIFPEDAGLIIADRHGAHVLREPPEHPLKPHSRKKVHLRFARASALRLSMCCAHAGYSGDELLNADEEA
ncbi:MAG: MmcB family DNA repair protein [Rhizobiaceae bacterium]